MCSSAESASRGRECGSTHAEIAAFQRAFASSGRADPRECSEAQKDKAPTIGDAA